MALRADLDVTPAQRDEIREIVESYRDELRPAIRQVGEDRRALRKAVMAPAVDEANISDRAAELGASITDLSLLAADIVQAIRLRFVAFESEAELRAETGKS